MKHRDAWRTINSALRTLAAAGEAIVRSPSEEREKLFEQLLAEVTEALRGWWAQLKEDYDRNPQQERERLDIAPEDALHSFYLECKAALIDPAVAEEIRARATAMFGTAVPSGVPVGLVIHDVLQPPVRIPKPKETPEELVELAINRVAEACRKYWAQAKANGNP